MKKRSAGHPRRVPGQLASLRLVVRCTAAEQKIAFKAARAAGQDVSTWIRFLVRREALALGVVSA